MTLFITLLGGMIETFLIILVGFSFVGISFRRKLYPLLVVSFYGSVLLTILKGSIPPYIYLLILIISLGVLLTFIIHVSVTVSLLALVAGAILLLLSEFVSFLLLFPLQSVFTIAITDMPVLIVAIPHMLNMLFIFFLIRKFNLHILTGDSERGMKGSNTKFYSILFLLFAMLFLYYSIIFNHQHSTTFTLLSAVFLVMITILIFYVIRYLLNSNLEALSMHLNHQYEEDLGHYINNVKLQRHDFVHHLLASKKMLDHGHYEECKEYLDEVLEEASSVSEILPLTSDAVAGMLLSYKDLAFKKNVHIHYIIYDNLRDIPCRVYELNKILGNLLLNSIEAVEIEEECKRQVTVTIGKNNNEYFFEISNFANIDEFEKNITEMFKEGFSTKKEKGNHGHGLSIVQSIVEKYKGYLYPELVDHSVTFVVKIPSGGKHETSYA
ncbi:GHKL domain-containing protein [Bacillus sp. BHET2]|uniref:sensor histidine kinase n=1 Tax=Bacillus sp. BHET2 TaxID=2583818 RepID=UPI00110E0655|nr:GHKL domain-containing protein [Bacillus sp. BHET2]TMU83460.1 GHKL domain-containing protein [Bacillus sp. BHET2]